MEIERVNVTSEGKRKLKATWTVETIKTERMWACGEHRKFSEFMTKYFYSFWNYNNRVVRFRKRFRIWGLDDSMREEIDKDMIERLKKQVKDKGER